jgi:tetratricopeptide (TPR) repeat protein
LWARHNAIWGPGSAPERVALTDELIELAHRTADFELEYFAVSFRWVALLEQGDERYLDQFRDFLAVTKRGRLARSEFASSVDQCVIYALMGRFAESEAFLDRALASFGETTHPHFGYIAHQLRWACWLLQGRFDELAELHRELAETEHPFPRLLEAISAAERGDAETLSALTDLVAAERPYPRDFLPLWLRLQAATAVLTDDPALGEQARADLEPYAGQWLVSLYGCDIAGPAEYWLAELDVAARRWDAAVQRFTEAERCAVRMRARPWSVNARAGLARALIARGSGEDAARASSLLAEVEREASTLGMRHVAERARQALSGASPAQRAPAPAEEFRRDGAVWLLGYAGRSVHLPDAKGLRDLHVLLGRAGTDVSAVRLLNPSGGEVVLAARRLGGDAVLDDEAKSRYQRHLERLDTEIDRLLELGDDERAAKLDTERTALLDELRAAAGLAGRTRRLGDEAECARKTVTARIRDTLRKLDQLHPELAAHLRASVVTGASCGYRPQVEVNWRL